MDRLEVRVVVVSERRALVGNLVTDDQVKFCENDVGHHTRLPVAFFATLNPFPNERIDCFNVSSVSGSEIDGGDSKLTKNLYFYLIYFVN